MVIFAMIQINFAEIDQIVNNKTQTPRTTTNAISKLIIRDLILISDDKL